jgi:hypothetical protein
MPAPAIEIRRPTLDLPPACVDALRRGRSADNVRGREAADAELARIDEDPAAFVAAMDDREAKGSPVTLPDGSVVDRIPGGRLVGPFRKTDAYGGGEALLWRIERTAAP